MSERPQERINVAVRLDLAWRAILLAQDDGRTKVTAEDERDAAVELAAIAARALRGLELIEARESGAEAKRELPYALTRWQYIAIFCAEEIARFS